MCELETGGEKQHQMAGAYNHQESLMGQAREGRREGQEEQWKTDYTTFCDMGGSHRVLCGCG